MHVRNITLRDATLKHYRGPISNSWTEPVRYAPARDCQRSAARPGRLLGGTQPRCRRTVRAGSGTLVRGGASYREAHLALELIAEHGGMRSFEIVEVNPLLDQSNITVELAVELILSAMGKTIL